MVEIAIVHVDSRGDVESEWCTLVNPERDLGPQHIHGITAAEARVAPRFAAGRGGGRAAAGAGARRAQLGVRRGVPRGRVRADGDRGAGAV
ncbi:hypothetical protein ACQP1P_40185 [Dactylosporangium sp. CA-052675]|uniref:hypothetical protein n=1 Tax=Dactylosporangium sp. CA-052675 TaxID=3239927 RepID=UPI003D913CD1